MDVVAVANVAIVPLLCFFFLTCTLHSAHTQTSQPKSLNLNHLSVCMPVYI